MRRIFDGDELPGEPATDRILIRPDPIDKKSIGGIFVPDKAQTQANFGTIVAAGLLARDQMYDNGHQIGDHIWYGQYVGVWAHWDHIVEQGKGKCGHLAPDEDWPWERLNCDAHRTDMYKCGKCGAIRMQEPLLVAKVDDVGVNEDLAERLRAREMAVVRGKSPDGQTQHIIVRAKEAQNGTA